MAPASGNATGKAYIVTGPTSGFGRQTALELARYGTVVLVGRDRDRLDGVRQAVERRGLAAALELARELPRLRVNAVEPGFSPGTGLGRDSGVFVRLLSKYLLSALAPVVKYMTNPKTAARVITGILTDESGRTGVYYDEKGRPMNGSALVRDPEFDQRVVAETRALLARVPA